MFCIADIHECVSGDNDCHVNANCQNTVGSYTCTCMAGYRGNGRTCEGTCILHRAVTQLIGYMENTAFDVWLYTLLGDAPVRNYWSVSIGILFAALGKVAILCDLVNHDIGDFNIMPKA